MKTSYLGFFSLLFSIIFIVASLGGGRMLKLMNGNICYTYLGCNSGFLGYDALMHGIAGFALVLVIVWLAKTSIHFNIFRNSFATNLFILLALIGFVGAWWEIYEYFYEHRRGLLINLP